MPQKGKMKSRKYDYKENNKEKRSEETLNIYF